MNRSSRARMHQMLSASTLAMASLLMTGAAMASPLDGSSAQLDPQIVIAGPGTPTTARDPVNLTGVGQMIVDEQNGFIGLCTGTLINPRTVIFAAHCVNERAASAYGSARGGQPIGFGFSNSNNTAGASAFGTWLNGSAGSAKYATNTTLAMYNVNQVVYNPLSLESAASSFLYGDVALATLDTPVVGVPTWSLLFSKLPATTITAAGTGYHVALDGYGNNGTGTTGSTGGIDYRRRLAANTLGGLDSLDDFESFLFGGGPQGLPQNLYWVDFDDPRRGTAAASPYDFNAWRDNAVPNEGITASGDSGGPLILDTAYSKAVVIGVLSGGYTRFFSAQPANGYGTASFYQPLYLYWDYISASNGYHYVTAKAGNASWTDATHWTSGLDPNYTILSNGTLVNGIPTVGGGQNVDTSGKFGQACFESGGISDCYDTATGTETIVAKPIGTGMTVSNDRATVDAASLDSAQSAQVVDTAVVSQASLAPADPVAQAPGALNPSPTLANGLPGATSFVPNNITPTVAVAAAYFDVTLSAAGTTTVSGAAVQIDNLNLLNSAGLSISAGASLASLIGVNMLGGPTLNVGGALTTPSIAQAGGVISGSGTITGAVFTTAGAIAPGQQGTIGTLTVVGDVTMSSSTSLLIDATGGAADRLAVSGALTVSGTVVVSAIGTGPRYGDSSVIATAASITGFATVTDNITGVLKPVVSIVTAGATRQAVLSIQADSFFTQFAATSTDQTNIAAALDGARATGYSQLGALYGALDTMTGASLAQGLQALAPDTARAAGMVAQMESANADDMIRERLDDLSAPASGTAPRSGLHIHGQGLSVAMASLSSFSSQLQPVSAIGAQLVQAPAAAGFASLAEAAPGASAGAGDAWIALPGGLGGFVGGRSLSGAVATGGGTAAVRGYMIGGGLDVPVGDNFTAGAFVTFGQAEATLRSLAGGLKTNFIRGGVYGRYDAANDLFVSGFVAFGGESVRTQRVAVVGTTSFAAAGQTQGDAPSFGVTVGKKFGLSVSDGTPLWVVPSAGIRFEHTGLEAYTETGSVAAMAIRNFNEDAPTARVGLDTKKLFDIDGFRVTPSVHLAWINAMGSDNGTVIAGFAAVPTTLISFASSPRTQNYGEIGVGTDFDLGTTFNTPGLVSFRYDANFGRGDLSYGAWTGQLRLSF